MLRTDARVLRRPMPDLAWPAGLLSDGVVQDGHRLAAPPIGCLKVRTVPAGDPRDLLPGLHGQGPLAWVRRGDGLIDWGEAATIAVPAGPDRFAVAERMLRALFDSADTEDRSGSPAADR